MKNFILSILVALTLASCSNKPVTGSTVSKTEVINGVATSTFKVWGNCDMCKETIESSLKTNGINSANWSTESNFIEVVYDTSTITLDRIQKRIASVGYDNEKYKGDDKAYSELPGCCQYDRK